MSTDADERADRGGGWDATRRRVLKRDDHACRFCGVTDDQHRDEHDRGLHAHHIIPKNDGGSDDESNLLTVCCRCHRTLEETHAKAIGEIEEKQNAETIRAKAAATYAVRHAWATAGTLDDDLAEFIDGHPTFRKEFGTFDENADTRPPCVESYTLRDMLGDVSSEWAFLVNYGYKVGQLDAAGYIEGWATSEAIDDDALAESELPDPRVDDYDASP